MRIIDKIFTSRWLPWAAIAWSIFFVLYALGGMYILDKSAAGWIFVVWHAVLIGIWVLIMRDNKRTRIRRAELDAQWEKIDAAWASRYDSDGNYK